MRKDRLTGGGEVAAAVPQRNAIAAIVNAWRVIAARSYHFIIFEWRTNGAQSNRVKSWEIIARNLKKRGWSLGYVSAMDSRGRTDVKRAPIPPTSFAPARSR